MWGGNHDSNKIFVTLQWEGINGKVHFGILTPRSSWTSLNCWNAKGKFKSQVQTFIIQPMSQDLKAQGILLQNPVGSQSFVHFYVEA